MGDDVPGERVDKLVMRVRDELNNRSNVRGYEVQEVTAKSVEVRVEEDVGGQAETSLYQVTQEPTMEGEEQNLHWEFLGSGIDG